MKRRILIGVGILLATVIVVGGGAVLAIDRSGYHYVKPKFALEGAHAADRVKSEADFTKPPKGKVYIVIDRTHNRLELRKGTTTTLSAVCSAGSGYVLKERDNDKRKGREWVFDTPRGIHRIRNKVTDPVWKRPDWDFIEKGEAIPRNSGDRIEYGMLGDYALHLGDGYMIHGTLYERLLGRGVTHGCIRLGKNDLATVYSECPIGTPVYIY
jgi:L,D-transpeptidase YbiS